MFACKQQESRIPLQTVNTGNTWDKTHLHLRHLGETRPRGRLGPGRRLLGVAVELALVVVHQPLALALRRVHPVGACTRVKARLAYTRPAARGAHRAWQWQLQLLTPA